MDNTEFKDFMFDHDIRAANSFFNTQIARPAAHADISDAEKPRSVREMGDVESDIPDVPHAIVTWNENKKISFKCRSHKLRSFFFWTNPARESLMT